MCKPFIAAALQTYTEPACAITGRAYVHPPSTFLEASEEEGNDVYLCDYEYDESWKRFRRRRYQGSGDHDAGDGILPVTPGGPAYQDLTGPISGVFLPLQCGVTSLKGSGGLLLCD